MLLSEKYGHMADEKLIEQLRSGNEEITDFLLDKYKNFVKKRARAMFIIGGDTDDLIQEGMIGLYKAIRDYNPDKESSFFSFADLCVTRQIYSAVSASKRKKHSPLNSYISLYSNTGAEYGEVKSIIEEMHATKESNPEELFIDKENVNMIEYELERSLSKFEKEVLRLYIEGSSYMEIAEILKKKPKSIDNALQRIKTKVSHLLND